MSMPIQRQSEAYGIFDDGPRFARERSSTDLPRGLAGLVNSMGPRITGGLLNTRHAVNVDHMPPDSHAYHTELPSGPGGEITWVDDADHYGRNPRREWNPDFGYEPTDEDERRSELVGEDDDSGYNWGPEPTGIPEHLVHGARRGSGRLPFDRTAGRRFLAFDDWKPYEAMNPNVEGHHTTLENGHNLSVHIDHSKPEQGWSWGLTVPKGTISDADGGNPQQMLELVTGGGKTWEKMHGAYASDHLPTREHAIAQAVEAYQTLYPLGGNHQPTPRDSGVDYGQYFKSQDDLDDDFGDIFRTGRRVALAPAPADPAAMAPQLPVGGGFLPAHRVGLDWRDSTIPGTVIANDGQVHIRWDDGQYTSEDPSEVRLL